MGISSAPPRRAPLTEAAKFGVEMGHPRRRSGEPRGGGRLEQHSLPTQSQQLQHVRARAVAVIVSGARYRRRRCQTSRCLIRRACIIGRLLGRKTLRRTRGSFGRRRAFFLAGQATVYLEVRRRRFGSLVAARTWSNMSRDLVDRISGLANVEVLTRTEIAALEGNDGVLHAVRWRHTVSGRGNAARYPSSLPVHRRRRSTDWLAGSGVALDPRGFVLTGPDAGADRRQLERRAPAYSRSATFAPVRSSVSLRQSAKEPRLTSATSIGIWLLPAKLPGLQRRRRRWRHS